MNTVETDVRIVKKSDLPYKTVVLNTKEGSIESTRYDKYNIQNSLTLFYDIKT